MNELEYLLTRYAKQFGGEPPPFDTEFTDEAKCTLLRECVANDIDLKKLDELDFLNMQYRYQFPDSDGVPLMVVPMTGDELKRTLRSCLRTGKPYELPADVERLIEQGAVF